MNKIEFNPDLEVETRIKEWASSKTHLLLGPTSSEALFPVGRLQEAGHAEEASGPWSRGGVEARK